MEEGFCLKAEAFMLEFSREALPIVLLAHYVLVEGCFGRNDLPLAKVEDEQV